MFQLPLAQPMEDCDLGSLRRLASGGASLPREVAEELSRRVPQVEITEGYGDAPTGSDGEICGRGPNLMTGYWKSPGETAEALRGGWLHTGDAGRFDEDGFLYVVDRIKDLIIRGGINIYPRDVEEALLEHPAIVGAAWSVGPTRSTARTSWLWCSRALVCS